MLKIHTKPDGNLSKTNSLHYVIYVRGVARIILTHHVDPELLIYWTLTSFICEVAAMWDSWWAISPEKNWETYHFDVYFLTLPEICLIWILMGIIIYQISETSMNKFKKYSVSQIGLPFLYSSDFKKFASFPPSVLNFKFFSITRLIFSHRGSEQFWKQNTIVNVKPFLVRSTKILLLCRKFAV